ncbi:MAG TPA: hypothetical protein VLB06_04725 [Sulfuricaulis sp.]|nr:hypothetical protein [Sulfuricaulis sp.]
MTTFHQAGMSMSEEFTSWFGVAMKNPFWRLVFATRGDVLGYIDASLGVSGLDPYKPLVHLCFLRPDTELDG